MAHNQFCAKPLLAQDRLAGATAVATGVIQETLRFGGEGLLQGGAPDGDSVRVKAVRLRTIPVTASLALGSRWSVEVAALYADGDVTAADAVDGGEQRFRLQGVSDVRVRAAGRFLDDALIVTLGANAPTGATALDGPELAALRVLAAPALGLGGAAVGAGAGGTVGLVASRAVGAWALALGGSYEVRGAYQPIAAFAAGAPGTEFRPASVVRALGSAEGRLGAHRVALALSGEFFGEDRLRGPADGAADPIATVTLGPVLGADVQAQLALWNWREALLWTSVRYRANHARDGFTVEGSDGTYVEGGARLAIPARPRTDLVLALDGRVHTGLAIDAGLATSGVSSGTATLGLAHRLGALSLQPFVRGTVGRVQARGAARDRVRAGLSGLAGGLVLLARF
jgi:hypothetical protein